MVEKFNERANTLGAEYWHLKALAASKTTEDRLEDIERLLEKGIGGKLRDKLDAEAKKLRKEKEDRSNASERLEEIKKELLELTADLAPNLDLFDGGVFPYDSEYEPISEHFFSALTEIFFGKPQSGIHFKVATFSQDGIAVNSQDETISLNILVYVMMIIQEAAKKMLRVENNIDKSCELLKQNEYAFIALGTLIREGKQLRLKEIKELAHQIDKEYKELMSDNYDRELVNGIEYLVSDEWEYNLVKEHNGEYEATDFGEWVWRICNAEASEEERKGRRKSNPNPNLNVYKILKFLKR